MAAEHHHHQTVYRITTFFNRKPGLTDEEFYNHWYNIHGRLCAPWVVKAGILGYKQFHTPPTLRSALRPPDRPSAPLAPTSLTSLPPSSILSPTGSGGAGGALAESMALQTYDGGVDFYVRSLSDFTNAFKDEYYLTVIKEDEDKFVDRTRVLNSTVGVERWVVRDGKVIVGVGNDGEEEES
ncbi:MAG: hypothetical protein M1835_003049 [Candelina submexicana]|nr:MAG: hypothetical protein M1835_003049 [Candelina submexicana]